VVDPKRTPAAQMADLWLAPRIGSDAALALAMTHVLISEGLYDRAFVERWCHGFGALARRAAQFTPALAEGYTGVPAQQIVAAAHLYAEGPSTFVSGHGIDAFSAGVQTFRAYHCLVAISGNVDRSGGNLRMRTPNGFRTYGELLHMPEFGLDEATAKRTVGAERFPLWAGPKGWQTACPSVIEAMLTGRPYPVRALYASGVNILVSYPDTRRTIEALRSLDFVAVAAHAMTPLQRSSITAANNAYLFSKWLYKVRLATPAASAIASMLTPPKPCRITIAGRRPCAADLNRWA